MKRMYVVLAIMFAVVFWAGTLLGQQGGDRPVDDPTTDFMEKRFKMREEMHRRMMDKLLKGFGPDKDMFADMEKMLDDMMNDSFTGFESLAPSAKNFIMEWQESTSGRTLVIKPTDPNQNLDINVSNGMVIVKGKSETKTANGVSVSNFTNSFNVPSDCDPEKVNIDQKDGKILVHFPFRKETNLPEIKRDERRPIKPSQNDIQI